jgi:hypothetical protein
MLKVDVIVPVIATIIFRGMFGLTAFESIICGLIIAAIIAVFKAFIKKKLGAMVIVGDVADNKCSVSVFLWNPTWTQTVRADDCGADGFCFFLDERMIIDDLKCICRKPQKKFTLIDRTKSKNVKKLKLSNISPKSLIEISFTVSEEQEKPVSPQKTLITLPPGVEYLQPKITVKTIEKLDVSDINLTCDYGKLNLQVLKYSRLIQTYHYVFSLFFVVVAVFMTFLTVFFVMALEHRTFEILMTSLATILSSLIYSLPFYRIVPPFVVKYLKANNYL